MNEHVILWLTLDLNRLWGWVPACATKRQYGGRPRDPKGLFAEIDRVENRLRAEVEFRENFGKISGKNPLMAG